MSPVKKPKITENKKIIASLRYQIVSLYQLLGKREDYMNYLRGKCDSPTPPLKSNEIEERLLKYEETKGKDKGRIKFNYITNEQLRSLKYKAKSQISSSSPSKK